jgi:hypothetical protein
MYNKSIIISIKYIHLIIKCKKTIKNGKKDLGKSKKLLKIEKLQRELRKI